MQLGMLGRKEATYSLPAVILPAAIHSLQEGKVVQWLCGRHVKENFPSWSANQPGILTWPRRWGQQVVLAVISFHAESIWLSPSQGLFSLQFILQEKKKLVEIVLFKKRIWIIGLIAEDVKLSSLPSLNSQAFLTEVHLLSTVLPIWLVWSCCGLKSPHKPASHWCHFN